MSASVLMAAVSCSQEPQPEVYNLPEVNFPMPEETISAVVGQSVSFYVEVVSAQKASIGWYVDGDIQSSSQKFDYVFEVPGEHEVSFIARNGAGSVQKDYTVNVEGDFRVRLSIADSTRIFRKQLTSLKAAAIEEVGTGIVHQWIYEGEVFCEEAFCDNMVFEELREYTITYHGHNDKGSLTHEFVVEVLERELEMSYSILDSELSITAGKYLSITATPLFGGTGLVNSWTVDGEEKSTEANLMWLATGAGAHTIAYHGENAKGETADRTWTVNVETSGYIFDSFEGITSLGSWWTLAQNQPGIELVDNPLVNANNPSAKCLRNKVNGTGGTSGYFDLTLSKVIDALPAGVKDEVKAKMDNGDYHAVRVLVYLNGNTGYFPRIQYSGTKYAPTITAKTATDWCSLEFRFPAALKYSDKLTVRGMLQENGNNITGGFDEATNNRTQYFDDFEFVE